MSKVQISLLASLAALLLICCSIEVFACNPSAPSCETKKMSEQAKVNSSTTVVLAVPGMTCAACPITIKKALNNVAGVKNIKVNFDKKNATVTFDSNKTNVSELTSATKNAGYPSSVVPVNSKEK